MSDLSDIESKLAEIRTLSPDCIEFTDSIIEGNQNYHLSFYNSNMNASRIHTDHSTSSSAIGTIQSYIDYLEGGISPIVPQAVTARQMRRALVSSGIPAATIDAMIASCPEPMKTVAHIDWEYSNEFHRTNPTLLALAPALGLTEEQVDNLFRLAATL